MATVIVLGAGASVCEALHRRPKWEKDRPPLDADFFARAAAARREPSLVSRIEGHAEAAGHPNPFTRAVPASLERYLGVLYSALLHSASPGDKSAYYALLRLYNRELSATTNWLIGRKRGVLEQLFRIELARDPALTVVTFNHDLLAESALYGLPRPYGRRWCLEHGYGFAPDDARHATAVAPAEVWESCDGGHNNQRVDVLKMHGSLNWVFATRDLNPSLNLATQRKPKYVLNAMKPRAGGRIQVRAARRPFYAWPVIVPPLYEKQGYITQHLPGVWGAAERALLAADRVIFFGYSFPSADHHTRFFFERLAVQNEALRAATIINPDFGVVQACADILSASGIRAYRSFADFADFESPVPHP